MRLSQNDSTKYKICTACAAELENHKILSFFRSIVVKKDQDRVNLEKRIEKMTIENAEMFQNISVLQQEHLDKKKQQMDEIVELQLKKSKKREEFNLIDSSFTISRNHLEDEDRLL